MTLGRRTGYLTVACLLVFLSATPTAFAQGNEFESVHVALAADVFDVRLTGERITGDEAADLRAAIDRQHGDDDGLVTDDEVRTYANTTRATLNEQLEMFAPSLTRGLLVEGRQPTSVQVDAIRLQGARGGVDDNHTIVRDYDVTIRFSDTVKERVNVTFAQDFRHALPQMSFETVTFEARAPWRIDAASIHPGGAENPHWDDEAKAFEVGYSDVPEFANADDPLSFHLTRETVEDNGSSDGQDSPAMGPVAAMVALGLVLTAATRGRRSA